MLISSPHTITTHDAYSEQTLLEFLKQQPPEFQEKFIPNLDHIDSRALNDNGITVLSVTHLKDNQYSMSYQYDWFVFSGCTDTDLSETETNKVSFKVLEDGSLEFDLTALGHD